LHLLKQVPRIDEPLFVAGIIDVDDYSEHASPVQAKFCETYLFDTNGGHQHIHEANLGIRADAYVVAGG
jgi:hypothetical protein